MSSDNLEVAMLQAMTEWVAEQHKTLIKVSARDLQGFSEQVKKEDEALRRYRDAQEAYVKRSAIDPRPV